jgi:acyl carrier protein
MLAEDLFDYVSERANVARATLDADTPLFSDGLLDSMSVLEVTAFIEQRSGVHFAASDINLDNLDSVGRMLGFVNSKRAGS